MDVINLNIGIGYTKYSQLVSFHFDIFCLCFTSQQSQEPKKLPADCQENPLKIQK